MCDKCVCVCVCVELRDWWWFLKEKCIQSKCFYHLILEKGHIVGAKCLNHQTLLFRFVVNKKRTPLTGLISYKFEAN